MRALSFFFGQPGMVSLKLSLRLGIWNLEDGLVLPASIILADLSRNKFTSIIGLKRSHLLVVIGGFCCPMFYLFILFQGYYVIMINGSQKCIHLIGFENIWVSCSVTEQ